MSTAGNNPQQYPFAPRRTCSLAIVSLVLSCVSFGFWPLSLGGIICGHLARREIRKNPGMEGDGLALAGLIIGYLLLVICLLAIVAFISLALFMEPSRPPVPPFHDFPVPANLFLGGWAR